MVSRRSPDEVEQHHRACVREGLGGDLAAPQPLLLEVAVGRAARRLLAVEEDELDRVARAPDACGRAGPRPPCRTRRRWRPRSRGCPWCRSARPRPRSPARGRARCRPRCGGRPAPPGTRRAARSASGAARAGATRASPPGAARAPPGGAAAGTRPRRRSGRADARGARRLAVRLVVAGERQVVGGDERHQRDSECDLYREHDPEQLHRRECRGCTLRSWRSRVTRTA